MDKITTPLLAVVITLLLFSCNEVDTVPASSQENDQKVLLELLTEIKSTANSTPCTDATTWKYTAYGNKACGGPQGYLAYPTNIDTTSFLAKVARYTQKERAFNEKWGIVSDCSMTQKPVGIRCNNGSAELIY